MKIQSPLFFFSLLLFTGLIQISEGSFGVLPPGRRQLERKVCITRINRESFVQLHVEPNGSELPDLFPVSVV